MVVLITTLLHPSSEIRQVITITTIGLSYRVMNEMPSQLRDFFVSEFRAVNLLLFVHLFVFGYGQDDAPGRPLSSHPNMSITNRSSNGDKMRSQSFRAEKKEW